MRDLEYLLFFVALCIGFVAGYAVKSNEIRGWTWERAYAVGELVPGSEVGENSISQYITYRFQRYGENWIALQNPREGDWILKRVG
ncbi:MAG: hypothetical protein QW175_04745 [Candidatus Bathyarchaeia archaeon]